MKTTDLDYDLPDDRIAQSPLENRSQSRLLVVDRRIGQWQDRCFTDLSEILRADDVLVLNNTRVLPAKFHLRRQTGGLIEGLWLTGSIDGQWEVLLRSADRLRINEVLHFEGDSEHREVTVLERCERGRYRLSIQPTDAPETILDRVGRVPLPHYIKRADNHEEPSDRHHYQTVYASQSGAVAAPTAGLHFDLDLLDRLRAQGITVLELTLHVGMGTFTPIEAEDLKDHVMHSEAYEIAPPIWDQITRARSEGRRIVAVGTTTTRVLETVARTGHNSGATNLFVYPPYPFRCIDALITNFHLPRSTLLAMIYAFGGIDLMRRVYAHAVSERYRFYSYGDAMLIV